MSNVECAMPIKKKKMAVRFAFPVLSVDMYVYSSLPRGKDAFEISACVKVVGADSPAMTSDFTVDKCSAMDHSDRSMCETSLT